MEKRSTAIGYYNIYNMVKTHIYMDVNILQNHLVPAAVFIFCDWMLMLIKTKKKGFYGS